MRLKEKEGDSPLPEININQNSPAINMLDPTKSFYMPSPPPLYLREKIAYLGKVSYDEAAINGPINLKRVVKLLLDPYSEKLYHRHSRALSKVVLHYQDGFLLRDLNEVVEIINTCYVRLTVSDIYMNPLLHILAICGTPFLKAKVTDCDNYKHLGVFIFSEIGDLLRCPMYEIHKQICENLLNIYDEKKPDYKSEKYRQCSTEYMMHLIDLSDIMLALVREYQHNSIFPKSYKMVLLTIMQKYSSNSVSCASQMVEGDLGCALMSQVTPTASLEFMMVVITILWNMHDKVEHTNTFVSQLRTGGSVRKLKLLFEHLVRESKTQHARQMRNNILVIVAQIATANPFTPFLEIGFLKQLIAYSIYPEVSIEEPCYFELKLKRCAEDFEMKKLLFSIMASLCHVNTTLEMMRSGKLLLGMFCYLETREKCRIDWLPAEYEEMQMHVLSCMCILCPLLPHCFILYNGPQLLLNFLKWCNSTIKFKGHGNCFLGEGSRGTKVAQTRLGLRLLFNMVATKDDKILTEFVDKGIISLILSMLDVALIDVSTCVKISNEMKTNLLMSISMFCEGNLQRKVLFGRRGVNIVMCFLRCDLDLLKSGLDYHFLLLTAIDCIWCTVIGCKELEDHFLEEDGCYILLDLLEVLPHKMRGIFLGCLVDLCFVNPKTIKHILTWRGSKTSISAPKLFCDIWRQEEKDMEVLSDSNGVISNIIFPLAGSIQRKQGIVLQPAKCASPAIVEVSENMRAKIYCLFTKIGFKNLPGMKLLDHIKLLVIECYMDFKTGEVWMEIIHELCSEHKATIEHDWNVCYAILRHYYHLSEQIKKAQDHIMCSYNKCNSLNEQQYYAQIRENYVQKEKEDDIWVKFVARTSRYSMLQAAKQRQRLSIESSRRDSSYMLRVH